jgi:predicted RNase H-like HicB family nuclease
MNKTAKDYLKEPYSRILIPIEGSYSAKVLEFHGCFAQGRTPEEAYANLEKAAESWIEVALAQGQEIPPPLASHDFSGRIALRVPRSIHKQAAIFAEMDDTSLNQFFLSAISARVGAEDFVERLSKRLEAKFATFVTTINLNVPRWTIGTVNIMEPQPSSYPLAEESFISFESGGLPTAFPILNFLAEKEAENG